MKYRLENGLPIASEGPLRPKEQRPSGPTLISDVLELLVTAQSKNVAMVTSVAVRFADFKGVKLNKLSLSTLAKDLDLFVAHLRGGKYAKSSVKSYRYYLRLILRHATEAGWHFAPEPLPPAWQRVFDLLSRKATKSIVLFAVKMGKSTKQFGEDELSAWRQESIKAGASLEFTAKECARFRGALKQAGLLGEFPGIKLFPSRFGISLMQMNPKLKAEIEGVLEWKTSEFQFDRPQGARIRQVSAESLERFLCQVVGYLQNVRGHEPYESLKGLVTKENMCSYTSWARNTRLIRAKGIRIGLGMLYAALRYNPGYSKLDLAWFENLSAQLPHEDQSTVDARKARKYMTYQQAEAIPEKIRAHRLRAKDVSARDAAVHFRDELLMTWLIILPWRQRNIRECMIGGASPNLFKAPIATFSLATKSAWVAAQEKTDPKCEFWQIRFSAAETKCKNEVSCFLPRELSALVEEYIAVHRSVLIRDGVDPGTLFLNFRGRSLTQCAFTMLVRKLASRYAGVATTPHLYRDIVAFEWLSSHPEDYLTVSKLLWHRDIKTTLLIYGRRFDESTGVARMDDWRASRR